MNWGKAQIIAQLEQMRPDVISTNVVPEGRFYVVIVYYRDGNVRTLR
jgi:hypothetical protein